MKKLIFIIFTFSLTYGQFVSDTNFGFSGGPTMKPEQQSNQSSCISMEERAFINENKLDIVYRPVSRDTVLFEDPMGNGGFFGDDQYITNYVDEDPSGYIQDYMCWWVTYNGHWGTDICIPTFYHMDEMITPVLAAADGIVVYTHDGEFDRRLEWNNGAVGNAAIIRHSDDTEGLYWHFKKHSMQISLGDTVQAGDTLAFVGSSGFSNWPHLHFEVQDPNGSLIDPWAGPCGASQTMWDDQYDHVANTPTHVPNFISSSYPVPTDPEWLFAISENVPNRRHMNVEELWWSMVRTRSLNNTDTLVWEFYKGDEFSDDIRWVPGNASWWPAGVDVVAGWSFNYWFEVNNFLQPEDYGEWTEKFYINSVQIDQLSYTIDDIPNQFPIVDFQQIEVELGQTITGEFTATDDGDPFWFNLETEPNNGGNIELYGGRRRKFTYTAPMDFTGYDVVGISATDDRGETGAMTLILFEVSGPGLINMAVEPSYIPLEQDSAFISATVIGGNDEVSVQAFINDVNSGEVVAVDLVNNNGDYSIYWAPETESFFNVDLQLINGAENDTILHEDIGCFTSVGPISVNMVGDLIAYPGDGAVLDFIVENNSTTQVAPDISILFEAESMNCLTNISSNIIFLGDIMAGESVPSGPNFFVAQLNNVCNSDSTILINVNIRSGQNVYWYDDFVLNIEILSTADGEAVPKEYALGGAYPNPFNPIARIDYDLIQKNYVTLEIHNLIGRKVKTLVSLEKDAGFHSTYWDATNNAGEPVAAGVYLYTIQAGEFRQTKKMILLK
jgi:murein DD-endopeptidase MepM/ murein hydrolase activator NlpD